MNNRVIDESIDISAPPDAVWRALTDASEVSKWFAWTASATPGIGGRLDMHWGPDIHWPMLIRVWDPPRHVRFEDHWPIKPPAPPGERIELFIDYFVEPTSGGMTRVRVVHNGFSPDSSWDGLYDSTSCGWRCELGALRFHLERHPGARREPVWISRELAVPLDEAYARLLGPAGLALDPRAAEHAEGADALADWRANVHPAAVTILRAKPGRTIVLTPCDPDGVLLMVGVEPPFIPGGKPTAMVRFSLYDSSRALAESLRAAWERRLAAAFG